MCGILFILSYNHGRTEVIEKSLIPLLHHRGPDGHQSHDIAIHNGIIHLHFHGTVLHLRGELTKQPLVSNHGHVFLWNGEIFGGDVKVPANGNDTSIFFEELQKLPFESVEEYQQQMLSLFAGIQGPWAFVFYDVINMKLWYGRDYFGRRSLLLRCKENTFSLSSLGHRMYGNEFSEVTAKQLYCLDLKNVEEGELLNSIKTYPLQPCYNNIDAILNTCIQHRCMSDTEDANNSNETDVCQQNISIEGATHNISRRTNTKVKMKKVSHLENGKPKENRNVEPSDRTDFCNSDLLHVECNHSELCVEQECMQSNNIEAWNRTCCNCLCLHVNATTNGLPNSSSRTDINNSSATVNYGGSYHCEGIGCSNSDQCIKDCDTSSSQYPHKQHNNAMTIDTMQSMFLHVLEEAVKKRVYNLPRAHVCCDGDVASKVGILFSGGIDSVVLTYLAHRCTPLWESIDLINVAFAQKRKVQQNVKKKHQKQSDDNMDTVNFDVPDRITGRAALKELPKERLWNFVEVDVTLEELQETRRSRITNLVYPLDSVLDDSIGCAIWFAARGIGRCYVLCDDGEMKVSEENYICPAKVLLTGMGADEQLGGYARHRTKFASSGWVGLQNEMKMEVERIAARNLGRDDRCISDHGREARFPFLDESVVSFLHQLPVCVKCDPRLPRGYGEKILLRGVASSLGASYASKLPKRAIQFGSKIAKLESSKEKGSDNCKRLENVVIS